ncbi:MAG: 2-C-methyl-D-erythritol 4-phosphate cytidylyltransferase [Cyclobacteriaceae bacterium]
MKKYAIIVAGGKGTRMSVETPKQFLMVKGKPVLVHTIERFLEIANVEVVLVLPKEHHHTWEQIKVIHFPSMDIVSVTGGASRTDSVKAGLACLNEDGLVAIHDAVRPFITKSVIQKCYSSAEEFGSGVAAVQLKDSLRRIVSKGISQARERQNYVLVQTPQTFRTKEIKEAYLKTSGQFPDDATVYEKAGFQVRIVEGAYSNIKITTQEDLK